jgi:hypothetical protein
VIPAPSWWRVAGGRACWANGAWEASILATKGQERTE